VLGGTGGVLAPDLTQNIEPEGIEHGTV